MDEYSREYLRRRRMRGRGRRGMGRFEGERYGPRARRGAPAERAGYGYEFGYGYGYGVEEFGAGSAAPYGAEYGSPYRAEYREFGGRARLPGKPARGFPVRGIHTYDLDYGDLAGPTTDYSGRVGYAEEAGWEPIPRGTYTPRLAKIGREARMRRRLYGGEGPTYSGPGRRGRGWR